MSQNQGHTKEEHEFQLRYFIARIVDDDAWMKACRMLEDVLAYPTKKGFAAIWKAVDAQQKGRSRDEVAKKPRVERKPRKARYTRAATKVAPMNPCPGPCGGQNGRFRFPDGKLAKLCPACHKASKKLTAEKPVDCDKLAPREDVAVPTKVPEKFGKFWKGLHATYPSTAVASPVRVALVLSPVTPQQLDRVMSAKRIEELKRKPRVPRHTGKTERKKMAMKHRRHEEE